MSRVARRVIVGCFDDAYVSSARDSQSATAGADAKMKSRPVAQTDFEFRNARVSSQKSPVAVQQSKANRCEFGPRHRLVTACRTQSQGPPNFRFRSVAKLKQFFSAHYLQVRY
jgi:hypothetical protein